MNYNIVLCGRRAIKLFKIAKFNKNLIRCSTKASCKYFYYLIGLLAYTARDGKVFGSNPRLDKKDYSDFLSKETVNNK